MGASGLACADGRKLHRLAAVLAALMVGPAWGSPVRLSSDRLALRFEVAGARARLVSLQAAESPGGKEWAVDAPEESLCCVTLQRLQARTVQRVSLDTAQAARLQVETVRAPREQELRLRWSGLRAPGLEGTVEVEARVSVSDGSALSRWKVAVSEDVPGWGVESVTFPRARFAAGAGDAVASPRGLGKLYRDPVHFAGETVDIGKGREMGGPYPWGLFTMQWMALTDNRSSLYLSTHDPEGKGKYFHLAPAPDASGLDFQLIHYPEEPLRSPYRWSCSYPAVLGIVRGDWWHCARVYREWAAAHAAWMRAPEGRPSRGLPAWLRQTPLQDHSYHEGMDESNGRRALTQLRATQALLGGFSTLVQYPGWNTRGFDIDYPDFFPARDWYVGDAEEARRHGLHYLPYINAMSLDVKSAYLAAGGSQHALDSFEVWPKLPDHGLVWACPQSGWPRDFAALAGRVARELHAEGIYFDQANVIMPLPCYSDAHGHPPGNQCDLARGMRRMVDLARQEVARIRPEVVFSGESFEECSGIELPLMCNYTLTDMDCPLAMAVYGDRLDPFGYLTTRSELARNRLSWRMKLAEQFVYGMLIGTAFGRPSAEDADIVSLTRNLAQARNEAWRYLQAGRMMHPPELDGDNPMVTAVWETYGTGTRTITRPTVRASSWLAEDGTAALVFVSVAEKPVRLRWSVARKDLGLVGDKLRLWTIRPVSQAGPVRLEGATLSHEVTVPPLDATVLKLAPA